MGPTFTWLLLLLYTASCSSEDSLRAKGYQSTTAVPDQASFPELRHGSIHEVIYSKPSTAIGFSGGGSRAYVAGLGQLAALTNLNLMKNVRYIGGISGGGWLATVYCYAQKKSVSDETLLGPIVSPERLTRELLSVMDPDCARSSADRNITLDTLKYWLSGKYPLSDAWGQAVADAYLKPAGILDGRYFSIDAETVADIKSRNPTLQGSEFYLPRKRNRPFYIVGSTIVGPVKESPYNSDHHNFTMLEITPLYIGQMRGIDVSYTSGEDIIFTKTSTHHIGGAIESFAFGSTGSQSSLLPPHQSEGLLQVEAPKRVFDLKDAACASSFAPGAFLESVGALAVISRNLGLVKSYWSPSVSRGDAPSTIGGNEFLFGDGGSYENIPLINFIQRRVEKIVLFFNSETTLESSDSWDVATATASQEQISDPLPAFFGVFPPLLAVQQRSYQYEKNQIFSEEDYVTVVQGLQAAQKAGRGIIFSMNLTTIQNGWWGIPEGITQEICFVYLGRVLKWEALLSPEMKDLLVPTDSSRVDNTKETGPFVNFPNYATYGGDINTERANALADLTGWVVDANKELFERLLGSD